MHPLRHPRNAMLLGLMFVFIGVVYWGVQTVAGWHVDYAGTTLLLLLGVAVSILAYVLVAGSPSD
jgi:DMSO reductase anchor subunit